MSYRKEYEKAFRKNPKKVRRLDALKLKLIQKMDTHSILMTEDDPREIIENIIIEAKKEVYDDILTNHLGLRIYDLNASISVKKIYDSKKHHLSTSEKKKEGK